MIALLAGGAQAASLAWPLPDTTLSQVLGLHLGQPVWWLQLLAMGVLACWLTPERSPQRLAWRQAAALGWLFASAWLACTFWWTFIALHTYGGLPAVLAACAVLALAALLALYYAAACALFARIAPSHPLGAALVFSALWLLAELARGVWLTGFGWGAVGYAHVDGPFALFAPWIGVYGIGVLAAGWAMGLAWAGRARRGRAWRVGVVSLWVALLWLMPQVPGLGQFDPTVSSGRLDVTLLQGNIPQDEKFEPGSGVPMALQWYNEQLQLSQTSLVIAPETAIPLLPQQLRPDYWQTLQNRFASGTQAALIGMPMGNYQTGYTNSVVGLKPGPLGATQSWRYDKQHLVPFGEFIPPMFKWFTQMMRIPLGDFNRGGARQAPFEWLGQRLALNICYEDLFGEELGLQFSEPTRAPTVFVNVSNLAWFGNSLAMDQHLQIARMRALEFARPFVLATNTGATAIVDYRGRVSSALARDTRAVLVADVEGRHGVTPFGHWVAQWGLTPYWALACAVVLLALWRRRTQPDGPRHQPDRAEGVERP